MLTLSFVVVNIDADVVIDPGAVTRVEWRSSDAAKLRTGTLTDETTSVEVS